jgi:hypothetical protein
MLDSHSPLFEKAAESNLQDSIKHKGVSSIRKLALLSPGKPPVSSRERKKSNTAITLPAAWFLRPGIDLINNKHFKSFTGSSSD